MRNPYGSSGYGPEKYPEFDGVSLWQQMKALCQLKRASGKQPRPVVKFSGHTAKVRLQRALALVTRRKHG